MSKTATPQVTIKDYRVEFPNDWCPGCGDFGILTSLQRALANLSRQPHDVAVVGGIGCSGKAQYYVNAYGIHTLHGRGLPYATGLKLANPDLTVVLVGGDGDGMGIGAGHFVNAGRRNVDLTYILFNNEVYGLTKGQASPTLPLGLQTRSLPGPTIQSRINPLILAMASGFTWIGRQYAYDVPNLTAMIQEAIEHPGLAFVEAVQPCPTYNDLHTREWFAGAGTNSGNSRFYALEDEGYNPEITEELDADTRNARLAEFIARANEWGDRIPVGVFLENTAISTYGQRIEHRIPTYHAQPPARRRIADENGRSIADLRAIFGEVTVP